MDSHTITLGRRELASLMDLDAHLAAAEAAFRALAEARACVPMPLHIALGDNGLHAKGASIVLDRPYAAVKVNSNFPGNGARGLPTIQGALLLYSGRDGRLLAIMDSAEITSKRTAAASALAARHLARRDSSSIAVCGCGEQGRAQLAAMARAFPPKRVLAWDSDAGKARSFAADKSRQLRLDVAAVERVEDMAPCDIVITCTSAKSAFLAREHVAAGTFIAAVGADNPHKSEIHPSLMCAARVVTDLTAQAQAMGDLHHAIEAGAMTAGDVHAQLGDVVSGLEPGRAGEDEITLFDSTGVAVQDVAAAAWAYERAFAARDVGNA